MANPDTATSVDRVVDKLANLFDVYKPELTKYQWPLESHRWTEFAFAVLEQHSSPAAAAKASRVLLELGLLDLGIVHDLTEGDETLVRSVLVRCGFDDVEASAAVAQVAGVADLIAERYSGKLQLLLREVAEGAIQQVATNLTTADADVRPATERWLQEVLNLPILVTNPAVRRFCEAHDISSDELIIAADRLDLNLAIVDDLIDWWHRDETAGAALEEPFHRGISGS